MRHSPRRRRPHATPNIRPRCVEPWRTTGRDSEHGDQFVERLAGIAADANIVEARSTLCLAARVMANDKGAAALSHDASFRARSYTPAKRECRPVVLPASPRLAVPRRAFPQSS